MKSNTKWILVAVVAAVLIIGGWLMSAYNSMVGQQEEVTTAWSNVEAAYQRRADMMPQLAKIVKAYAKHERETFAEVTKARNAATQIHLDANDLMPEKLKAYEQAQNQLSQAFSRLIAVSESYPELKASENYKSLMVQEEGTENRVNEARRRYNEAVQGYNLAIRRFPNNILAGMYGFERMAKFEASQGAEKAPDLDI